MMNLQTRTAHGFELELVARLAAHSFPGLGGPELWHSQLRDPRYGGGLDSLVVTESAGDLVAACQLHPLRMWLGGALLPVAGVGTVSVAPTHRKRGLAASLVTGALHIARDRGDVCSALYPFRDSFYRNLGYGATGAVLQYQVPVGALPGSELRAGVELLEDGEEALRVYNEWAPTQNGQLERSTRMWDGALHLPARHTFGYRAADGALEGYARVNYRTEQPRYLDVDELVWTTADARRALYGWIASLGDQWQHVMLRALPSHRLADWLAEARLPAGTAPSWNLWGPAAILLTGPMLRIVDMAGAWRRRRVRGGASVAVAVHVQDEQLPENNGEWSLSFEAGHASASRGSPGNAPRIRTDIATLSRLYAGSLRASEGRAAGLLECEDGAVLAELDRILSLPDFWLFDRF